MDYIFPQGVRVGGSALPDGVMMLTPLAVAIARVNPNGGFFVESSALPARRKNLFDRIPFVRIFPKLIGQISLVVRGWKPRTRRFPAPLLGAVLALGITSSVLNLLVSRLPPFWHATTSSLLQLGLFFGFIAITRTLPQFSRIWRFHGGEHQAIGAYEAGLALNIENVKASSLYHPRCGTNLATLSLILMVPGMIAGSLLSGILGYFITVAVPIAALCIAFEMVMFAQNRLRAILWPGLAFQRLTVAVPKRIESLAGIAALEAALIEHGRVEAEANLVMAASA